MGLSVVVLLTHDHDVYIRQNTAMTVGGFTLVDSAVLWCGIMEHHSIIKHSSVAWVIWRWHNNRVFEQTKKSNTWVQEKLL